MMIEIPREAILSTLDRRGWAQENYGDLSPEGTGPVCLHGAIRLCDPVPGDAFIIEQVWQRRSHGPDWNDSPDTTEAMVREYIRTAPNITDEELAEVYGPQWREIVALVRRCAVFTLDECKAWDSAWAAARDSARDSAWALVVRDLIGRHGFAQEHYDTLTLPWRRVIGPLHPDDEEVDRGE